MVKNCNKRIMITMNKNSIELISKFASSVNLTMSQFIESVCCSHIIHIVKEADKKRKALEEKVKNEQKKNTTNAKM